MCRRLEVGKYVFPDTPTSAECIGPTCLFHMMGGVFSIISYIMS